MLGIGIMLVLVVSAVLQFLQRSTAVAPTGAASVKLSTTTAPNTPASLDVTAVSVTPASYSVQTSFAVADGDTIVSWDFKGAYTGNPELVAKAQSEIARLSAILETATSSAMILSVGIANQYELLGDGKKQYEYLERAIKADMNITSGLPWHNLGVLMERLGALETARVAHEKSTVIQPELKQWHYSYIEFLTSRTKDDTAHIEKAFAFAEKNIGKTSYLVELRTVWQKP